MQKNHLCNFAGLSLSKFLFTNSTDLTQAHAADRVTRFIDMRENAIYDFSLVNNSNAILCHVDKEFLVSVPITI
jgi:hypothetical protein